MMMNDDSSDFHAPDESIERKPDIEDVESLNASKIHVDDPDEPFDDESVAGEHEEVDQQLEDDEPEYTKANSFPFHLLCRAMRTVWKLRIKNPRKVNNDQKLAYLLKPNLIKEIEPQSLYPILRLYLPDMDNSRNIYVKEKGIATMYADALGLVKGQHAYDRLFNYNNPTHNEVADLSLAVFNVMSERIPSEDSSVTVGRVNELLDQLCQLQKQQTKSNHDWRQSQQSSETYASSQGSSAPRRIKKSELLGNWMRTVIREGLSPVEHKWLVRIMLKKMELGVGWRSILKWYHPYALEIWNAHNSLKAVCNKICRGDVPQRESQSSGVPIERHSLLASYMIGSGEAVEIFQMLGPMLSSRSSFERVLHDISSKHATFLKGWEGTEMLKVATQSLACKFPTFCMEIKLDGERMIVHIQKGVVKMQTRNARWYSDWFSPVLGPSLRKAIARYDVNVILDGEVTAWDDVRKEYVPFGNSRTIAASQLEHMRRQGLLDDRDFNLHGKDEEGVYRRSSSQNSNTISEVKLEDDGESDTLGCWLKFEVFDVLYVSGRDASKLLSESLSKHRKPHVGPGSILHLDGFERKKILYRLLDPQQNQVEIVPTLVVRSNGHTAKGSDYFSPENPTQESGYPAYTLDSIDATFNDAVPSLESVDKIRREGCTDGQINDARSSAVERFYLDIVETRMLEGLIFKDLSAPYVLGEKSRRLRYWHKIKPDYAITSWATDIDVVILGAFYGTGLKNSGVLSHFLCGCVDSANEGTFLTFCKINGRSVSYDKLKAIFEWTGYKKSEEVGDEVVYGKWFLDSDHGNSLPEFISHRSFQSGKEDSGWTFSRSKTYPDLWINPENSVVLTIYGGEIITSDDFSVGLTLRFPRIERIRLDDVDGSEKSPFEVASDSELWRRFQDADRKRSEAEYPNDFYSGSPSMTLSKNPTASRFLTPEQYVLSTRAKRKKIGNEGFWSLPEVDPESSALRDVVFTVLEGKYVLNESSLDAEVARAQGWYDEAKKVRNREDVMKFIIKHGGLVMLAACGKTTFVLGGQETDAKVVNHHRANQNALAQPAPKNKTSKAAQALEDIRRTGAVLKWTFVFSLIQSWLRERRNERRTESGGYVTDDETDISLSIKSNKPELLIPKPLDYLISSDKSDLGNLFGLDQMNEITLIDLKRALDAVDQHRTGKCRGLATKRIKSTDPATIPWQFEAVRSLPIHDRWVMGGEYHTLWPYTSLAADSEHVKAVVLYPDIFQDSFGLSSEMEANEQLLSGEKSAQWTGENPSLLDVDMMSSISLARTMGALVTPHLHDGVTHILCNMVPGVEARVLHFSSSEDQNHIDASLHTIFCHSKRGQLLVERLRSLHATGYVYEVEFVSSTWVRTKWLS